MRYRLLFSLALITTTIILLIPQQDSDGISWFDPREGPFQLCGFEWIKEEQVYRRLPVNPDWEIHNFHLLDS